ncbi:LLM class flavin-dependent oxidoreductase [Streptomyces hainanensis]|uniref:LLM class flavin-dependent oxidoreductase n=1 Tax=Streptomyces hainanensis TaxID=402648 RepID=A0A4R4TBI2_9ACTN|nr:LLM class flavin-dependent oxidoreductase [Streptomyces hainanensis]TDC74567.1 LLM class flavin-dependent oxidoreductase [Streptomyces hainanensis]
MTAPTPLRFGLMTYEAAPWDELTARWRAFERQGWDALWAGDHLWSDLADDGTTSRPRFDAWLLAAGIAAATERVTVGTLVSAFPLRNPAVLAKQAITLDHLSGGRFVTGIGAGGNPRDHAVAGADSWEPAERAARFGEYATVVRGMLDQDRFDFAGDHYRVEGAVRAPAPLAAPRPPLLVAAHLESTLTVAARHADVWSSYGSLFSQLRRGVRLTEAESVRLTARRGRLLDEHAERAGRDPATIRKTFMAGFTEDAPFESVERFRDFVGRYATIGITEFMFPFPLQGRHRDGVFEEVVARVLPALRTGEAP